MRTSTLAILISNHQESLGETPVVVDTLFDEEEIGFLEAGLREGDTHILQRIYEHRAKQALSDEEFGNYIEDLLSQPFVKADARKHGIQWLKSKIRSDEFHKLEKEAAQVITEYAFRIFLKDRHRTDFFLLTEKSQVRVRLFFLPETSLANAAKPSEAV